MPKSNSMVVTYDVPGVGTYSVVVKIDYDKPAAGLSQQCYCNVTAEGYGDNGPNVYDKTIELHGTVTAKGVFTTSRSPLSAGGTPMDEVTLTMYQHYDAAINRTERVVLHLKVDADDETAGSARVLTGRAWIHHIINMPTDIEGGIDVVENDSDEIGFTAGVYKSP